jgi:hypothetical protein
MVAAGTGGQAAVLARPAGGPARVVPDEAAAQVGVEVGEPALDVVSFA